MAAIKLERLTTMEGTKRLHTHFSRHYPWYKQDDYFKRCLHENIDGSRITLMAYYEDQLAGCCHLLYDSDYLYFRENRIPEINDLNVFPEFQRKKIATAMFDELEAVVSESSQYIGVGVGLYKDYGKAQRMYTSRGYVMDGNGLTYMNVSVTPGKSVLVDDDLIIYLIKDLKSL